MINKLLGTSLDAPYSNVNFKYCHTGLASWSVNEDLLHTEVFVTQDDFSRQYPGVRPQSPPPTIPNKYRSFLKHTLRYRCSSLQPYICHSRNGNLVGFAILLGRMEISIPTSKNGNCHSYWRFISTNWNCHLY